MRNVIYEFKIRFNMIRIFSGGDPVELHAFPLVEKGF